MQHHGILPILAFLAVLPLSARAQGPAENFSAGPPLALAPQIDLETALQWTLQSNPNLVATRQNLSVSAEALDVAQYFPTSLNPSISVDYTPWVYERQPNGADGAIGPLGFYHVGPAHRVGPSASFSRADGPGRLFARRDGPSCRPS